MNKVIKFVKSNYLLLMSLVFMIIFVLLLINVYGNKILNIDNSSYGLIKDYISKGNTNIFKIITSFANTISIIIISIIFIFVMKSKRDKMFIAFNIIFVTILNNVVKLIVQRNRPSGISLIDERGYSFPSGHSMISMAFYGFMIYLVYKKIKNKWLKILMISLLSILILLIGISRIYLGVHYFTDVLGGFCLSLSYLMILVSFYNSNNVV